MSFIAFQIIGCGRNRGNYGLTLNSNGSAAEQGNSAECVKRMLSYVYVDNHCFALDATKLSAWTRQMTITATEQWDSVLALVLTTANNQIAAYIEQRLEADMAKSYTAV